MTSRFESGRDSSSITRRRQVTTCARCRTKRIKCDRGQPSCSNCLKARVDCQFPFPPPSLPRKPAPGRPTNSEAREDVRLSRLEDQVARLSREVESNSPAAETPSTTYLAETGSHLNQGMLIIPTKLQYFSPYSWVSILEDLSSIYGTVSNVSWSTREQFPALPMAMPTSYMPDTADAGHFPTFPDKQLQATMLGLFRDRVDPFVRILHLPSFLERYKAFRSRQESSSTGTPVSGPAPTSASAPQRRSSRFTSNAITASASSPVNTSPSHDASFKSLLLSVFYAAAVAVVEGPDPTNRCGNQDAALLMAQYKCELDALFSGLLHSAAGHRSTDILQALVIMLSVESTRLNPQAQWQYLGLAVRMAKTMGFHRDPASYGMPSIEVELRRRTWAQICSLDVQFAEELGCEPIILPSSFDTRLPLSISDQDLTVLNDDRTNTHTERDQEQRTQSPPSKMTFALVLHETARLRMQLFAPTYVPSDSIYYPEDSKDSVGTTVPYSSIPPTRRTEFAAALDDRYRTVYGLEQPETPNVFIKLTSRVAALNVAKAKFLCNVMAWKETRGRRTLAELNRLLRDATAIANQTSSLLDQCAETPHIWYLKRLRDVYSSSFLIYALIHDMKSGFDRNLAWTAIDGLFPEANADIDMDDSLFGAVLRQARERRHQNEQQRQELRERAINAAIGTNQAEGADILPPSHEISYPSSAARMSATNYQHPGNLFEDFEQLVQESLLGGGPDVEGDGSGNGQGGGWS